jgi:hypothetical protein
MCWPLRGSRGTFTQKTPKNIKGKKKRENNLITKLIILTSGCFDENSSELSKLYMMLAENNCILNVSNQWKYEKGQISFVLKSVIHSWII